MSQDFFPLEFYFIFIFRFKHLLSISFCKFLLPFALCSCDQRHFSCHRFTLLRNRQVSLYFRSHVTWRQRFYIRNYSCFRSVQHTPSKWQCSLKVNLTELYLSSCWGRSLWPVSYEKDGRFQGRPGACDRLYKAETDAINHRQVKYNCYVEPRHVLNLLSLSSRPPLISFILDKTTLDVENNCFTFIETVGSEEIWARVLRFDSLLS